METTNMLSYKKHNINPQGNVAPDCVIRAIATLEEVTWYEVYDDLCALAREKASMPNARKVWTEYLEGKGYKRYGEIRTPKGIGSYRKATVGELPVKTALVKTNRHVLAVVDGECLDLWDSRNEVIRSYYIKN